MTKADQDKAERLAAALRENLKRRKAQSREASSTRQQEDGPESGEVDEPSKRPI